MTFIQNGKIHNLRNFEFVKLESLNFDLKSVTTENGRLYQTPSGEMYPSVTTVLSSYNKKDILKWRERIGNEEANKISQSASRKGTRFHHLCENYIRNQMDETKISGIIPDIKELFLKIKPILDNKLGKIYALEQSLYSDSYKIAGRVDCIAEWNGQISVIDFKTSARHKNQFNIQNYFMQCTAYALMFSELTGIWIDDIVVCIASQEGAAQVFERQINEYREPLLEYIHKYK